MVAALLLRRVSRSRSKHDDQLLNLTKEEEEQLIAEWQPEPLVPDVDPDHPALHVPTITGKVIHFHFRSVPLCGLVFGHS